MTMDDGDYRLPLAHLIYMPQQEHFLASMADKLPFQGRQRLQSSNRELPPMLRLLIPAVRTMEEYRDIQTDPKWLQQQVKLNKKCYELLYNKIVYQAKQSERLDAVQSAFQ